VTVYAGGSTIYPAIQAYAFAGVTAYDSQENGAVGTSSPLAVGSVTPSVNGALFFTGMTSGASHPDTQPSGFTGLLSNTFTGGSNFQGSAAYYIQPTAAALNAAWTWSGGTKNALAGVAVFRGAAAAPARTSVIFIG
jgi:hypothetical protein